ncbi:hypothetical protein DMJ13_19425 [halophilic archaeon]|nr:hypothetical protein DMJ13_19425 [halophilic archaeon]
MTTFNMSEYVPKTRPTYYTSERVAAARRNVEEYEWAARKRDEAVEAAAEFLERGFDGLWRMVTGQAIPRSGYAGDGTQDDRWTPGEEPWTVTDGETVLPTNDFAAFRESGRDDRGWFDPGLADDSLLVNERSPERGEDWGVDDGFGWEDEAGDVADPGSTMTVVAQYNHYYVWYRVRDAVVALRDAYLYTGEQRYARAGTVLLDRIADAYPDLDISAHDGDKFWNSHGGTGDGKAVGSIWETNLVRAYVSAYDAFFPAMNGDDELVEFLSGKAEEYPGLPSKDSVSAIRKNVETRLVRRVLPGVRQAQIRGNLGMHHSALAMAAVVADDPEGYTGEALSFLFESGELRNAAGEPWTASETGFEEARAQEWRVTGCNLAAALVDRLDRDGYADEAAPNYNFIIQRQLLRVADILSVYADVVDADLPVDPDLYAHPKLRRATGAHFPLLTLDRYMPPIGDSGKAGEPDRGIDVETALRGFQRYGDPEFARAAYLLNGDSANGLHGDVFSTDAGSLPDRIADVVASGGRFNSESRMLPGYGFTVLRGGTSGAAGIGERGGGTGASERGGTGGTAGTNDDRRALWLYYGRNSFETGTSHAHQDSLNLSLYAHGLCLAPDLGYPEFTGNWPKGRFWTKNTVSHNTVVVDAERQRPQSVGVPRHFADADGLSLTDVEAPRVYPQTDVYRRTTAMVRIDESDAYVVDLFRVAGGEDHVYSFHGSEGDVATDGLDTTARDGTFAGVDVPRPADEEVTDYDRAVGSGFNYLTDVATDDDPSGAFEVEWDATDTWDVRDDDADVRLTLTMLGDYDEVTLADGEPPRNKAGNPESLRYLLCRNHGHDPDSAFTAVLEPHCGERRVRDVSAVPVTRRDDRGASGDGPPNGEGKDDALPEVRAVRVELDTDRVDYLAWASDPDATYEVGDAFAFSGFFARYSEVDGAPVAAQLCDGDELATADGATLVSRPSRHRFTGRLVGFTRDLSSSNELVVDLDEAVDPEAAVGDFLYVDVAGDANGVYPVESVERQGENRVAFDVGGATTVEGFVDPEDPDAGYEHVVETGARVRSPAFETWSPES